MKRDGLHLWSIVTATVRPFPGRSSNQVPPLNGEGRLAEGERGGEVSITPKTKGVASHTPTPLRLTPESTLPMKGRDLACPHQPRPPDPIEPNRYHRLTRASAPTLDLHDMNQDRARAALTAFILRVHAEGERTVLIITGKGALGDGILRRRTPEWLSEPPLRPLVAGLSEAHRKHGGAGALYVALKWRER